VDECKPLICGEAEAHINSEVSFRRILDRQAVPMNTLESLASDAVSAAGKAGPRGRGAVHVHHSPSHLPLTVHQCTRVSLFAIILYQCIRTQSRPLTASSVRSTTSCAFSA
jgi:hypothetical protein